MPNPPSESLASLHHYITTLQKCRKTPKPSAKPSQSPPHHPTQIPRHANRARHLQHAPKAQPSVPRRQLADGLAPYEAPAAQTDPEEEAELEGELEFVCVCGEEEGGVAGYGNRVMVDLTLEEIYQKHKGEDEMLRITCRNVETF
jgi:hypothetical protein